MTRASSPFTRLLRVGGAGLLALGLAACGPGEAAPPATVTVTATEPSPEPTEPAQRELTQAETDAALPKPEDVSPILVDYPFEQSSPGSSATTSTSSTTDWVRNPAVCDAIFFDTPHASAWMDKHESAHSRARYVEENNAFGMRVLTSVKSFDDPVPDSFFTEAGEAMGQCDTFTEDHGDGASEYGLTAVSMPNSGDRSIAFQMSRALETHEIYVKSGHNLIRAMAYGGNDTAQMHAVQKAVDHVLAELDKDTPSTS